MTIKTTGPILFLMLLINPFVSLCQKGNKYKDGYYYDLQNNKIDGLIYYAFDYINSFKFKENSDSKPIRIDVEECKAFVIEKDSFTVINNFQFEGLGGGLNNAAIGFVQVLESGTMNLYKHYSTQGSGNPSLDGSSFGLVNFIVKKQGSHEFITIRKRNKNKFKEQISKLFNIPSITDKVTQDIYKWEHMIEIVKEYNAIN